MGLMVKEMQQQAAKMLMVVATRIPVAERLRQVAFLHLRRQGRDGRIEPHTMCQQRIQMFSAGNSAGWPMKRRSQIVSPATM